LHILATTLKLSSTFAQVSPQNQVIFNTIFTSFGPLNEALGQKKLHKKATFLGLKVQVSAKISSHFRQYRVN
jgi:hypothetical protein